MRDVFIRDEKGLEEKINYFKTQGASKIQIISDFDRTLTKAFFMGKKIQTSYSLIREGNYLSKDYPKKAFALFDKYHPYEISKKLSIAEKSKFMDEWWDEHLKLMVEKGMSKSVVDDIINKGKTVYREGFFEFASMLKKSNIPFLILSAGLGDIIKGSLIKEKSYYENMKLIANFYDFNQNGTIKGYLGKIIHPFNKNEASIKNTKYFEEIKERKNAILLGDMPEDIDMAKGIIFENMILIGFLNENQEELFHEYSNKYDIVLLNDSSMIPAIEILKRIIVK